MLACILSRARRRNCRTRNDCRRVWFILPHRTPIGYLTLKFNKAIKCETRLCLYQKFARARVDLSWFHHSAACRMQQPQVLVISSQSVEPKSFRTFVSPSHIFLSLASRAVACTENGVKWVSSLIMQKSYLSYRKSSWNGNPNGFPMFALLGIDGIEWGESLKVPSYSLNPFCHLSNESTLELSLSAENWHLVP